MIITEIPKELIQKHDKNKIFYSKISGEAQTWEEWLDDLADSMEYCGGDPDLINFSEFEDKLVGAEDVDDILK